MIDEARPIFITGLMRTGSTLFLSLIDGHPELLVYPDEPSFERLYGRRYQSPSHLRDDFLFGTPNPLHLYEGVKSEALDPIGFSPRSWEPIPPELAIAPELIDRAIGSLRLRGSIDEKHRFDFFVYHETLRRELDALPEISPRGAIVATMRALAAAMGAQRGARYFVYKQPLPHFREESAARFFEDFPDGKMIVLQRDPRALLASLLDYTEPERRGFGSRVRRELYFIRRLGALQRDIAGFEGLREIYGAARVLFVDYERLIEDVPSTMRRVADFLGVEDSSLMHSPTKLGRPVDVPTANANEAGAARRIYSSSLERYRKRLGSARLRLIDGVFSERDGVKPPLWVPLARSLFALLHRMRPLDPLAAAGRSSRRARREFE